MIDSSDAIRRVLVDIIMVIGSFVACADGARVFLFGGRLACKMRTRGSREHPGGNVGQV